MNIRGTVTEPGEARTVSTQYGERDLVEVAVQPDDDVSKTVTLWGKWAETAEYLEAGMELLVTDAEESEYQGETTYATSKESYVVVEPGFLVNVTDVRSWVQCPRMYYLNKLSGIPLNYPVVKGTIVHEVFGDLLRGRELDDSIEERVHEVGLQLGLLGREADEVAGEVRQNARAIEGWLEQGVLDDTDDWRSEYTLISERFGIKGRCDALRRGMPVELKTGKNTNRDPRFQDKIQAACYALLLQERDVPADTGTLLYTKNSALDRAEETGDLSPAKEFSIAKGLLEFVVRTRNEIAAMEFDMDVPTGKESNAKCEYCFEKDTCMVVSGRLNQESKAGQIGKPIPADEREYFHGSTSKSSRNGGRPTANTPNSGSRRPKNGPTTTGRSSAWNQRDRPKSRANAGNSAPGRPTTRSRRFGRATSSSPATATRQRTRGTGAGRGVGRRNRRHDGRTRRTPPIGRVPLGVLVRRDVDRAPRRPAEGRRATEGRAVRQGGTGIQGRGPTLHREQRRTERGGQPRRKCKRLCAHSRSARHRENLHHRTDHSRAGGGRQPRPAVGVHEPRCGQRAGGAPGARIRRGEIVRVGTETGVREDMQDVRLERSGDPGARVAELKGASVVAATTATCGSRIMREEAFDVALVDEASQLTEPATHAAINLAERFVLVGDHHQLPPVVRAETELSHPCSNGSSNCTPTLPSCSTDSIGWPSGFRRSPRGSSTTARFARRTATLRHRKSRIWRRLTRTPFHRNSGRGSVSSTPTGRRRGTRTPSRPNALPNSSRSSWRRASPARTSASSRRSGRRSRRFPAACPTPSRSIRWTGSRGRARRSSSSRSSPRATWIAPSSTTIGA